MSSVLRPVRKRKKVRTLGSVDIIRREDYADLELDAKVELIRSLVPLGLLHVQEVLDQEVRALAGERYARKDASVGGRRHGSNPGTVGLAGQRVPMRVPRIRGVAGCEIPLCSYEALHRDGEVNDLLLKRVLYGISCRNYEAAAAAIPGAIGLSGSTVSRAFIGIEHEGGAQGGGHPPADDAPGEHIDDERRVDEAAPRGHIGQIRHPELIRTGRGEVPVHQVAGAITRLLGDGRPAGSAPDDPL